MEPIKLSDLKSYSEDRKSLARFERKFAIPSALGVITFIAVLILSIKEKMNWIIGVPICVVSLAGIFITVRIMEKRIPISQRSGLKMNKYLRADGKEDEHEIVYVCHESKTYFTRVFYSAGD